MDEKKYTSGDKILGAAFLIWFVASIAGMIGAAKLQEMGWVAIVFGQYFIVFGFAGLFNEIKSGFRHPIVITVPVVGLLVVICGLLWQFGDEMTKANVASQIPNMAAGMFMLVGALLLIGIIYEKLEQKMCTHAVQGKCVDVKWHYSSSNNGRNTKTYCPVYEYYYNGQTYTGSQEIYTNIIHVGVGEYREIFINPNKPTVFYEKGMSRALNLVSLIIGVLFILVSAVVVYAYNFM